MTEDGEVGDGGVAAAPVPVQPEGPWPFARLEVVSIVPVAIDPHLKVDDWVRERVAVVEEWSRDGDRDVREVVWQDAKDGMKHAPGEPAWYRGPVPLRTRRCVVGNARYHSYSDSGSLEERRRHFPAALVSVLYGDECRAHRAATDDDQYESWRAGNPGNPQIRGLAVRGLELLRFTKPRGDGEPNGVLLAHFAIDAASGDALEALRLVTDTRPIGAGGGSTALEWFNHLCRAAASVATGTRRAFHVCLAQPSQQLPQLALPGKTAVAWTPEEQWFFQLATAQKDYPPPSGSRQDLAETIHLLSGDWNCAIMRNGAVFLTRHVSDEWEYDASSDRFSLGYVGTYAPLLVASLYTDVLALAYVKSLRLEIYAENLAALGDPVAKPEELRELEGSFTRFRNQQWWENTGLSDRASMLLRIYGDGHGQQRQFDRLAADFSDYSQKVERDALRKSNDLTDRTNALIGFLTFVGVPLAALQVFGTDKAWLWIAIPAFLIGVTWLPAGRALVERVMPNAVSGRVPGWLLWLALAFVCVVFFGVLWLEDVIPTEASGAGAGSAGSAQHR